MPHSPTKHPLLSSSPAVLAQLVQVGRLSDEDADQLRAALDGAADPIEAAYALQAKHAAARVSAAVRAGVLTERQGEAMLQRLCAGEDPAVVATLSRGRADWTSE